MTSRDKDNREKRPEPSAHLDNNVKDKDNNAYTKQKRKTVERERESAEEVVAMTTFGDENNTSGGIVKEGIDTESPESNNDAPPLHKKKVKSRRIKMKQRSNQDLNDNAPASAPSLSIYSSEQKIMIDTNKNSAPNNVSYESPSNTIDEKLIQEKTTPEKIIQERITNTSPNKTNAPTNNNTTNNTTDTRTDDTTNIPANTTNTTNNISTRTNVTANRTLSKSDALPTTKTKEGNTQQQDKMQKLAFLTDLYDQGYITVVEYKERKSQIIDELTGTRTRTRTRNNSHVLHPPTVVASPPPDWSTIREETALRHVFDTAKNQWTTTVVKVKLDKDPFACGGLRKCYHLHDCTRPEDNYVAKLSIDPFEDHEIYFIDVEIQMRAKEFAKKFNQYNPPKNVDFVMAWLLELIEREGRPLCGVEIFIEGPYRKHNNNFGYVSEDERNTPQAFSHFTYEASNHKILICDIQGVADLYTDPQMHTIDIKKTELMGKGNMGVRGISKFLATHQCNAICRYLRLPSINAKLIDAGTVPAQTYMSYQKVDVVNIECYHPSPHLFGAAKTDNSPLLDPPVKEQSRACCCTIL